MFHSGSRLCHIDRDVNHAAQRVQRVPHVSFARATRHATDRQACGANGGVFKNVCRHTPFTRDGHLHYTERAPKQLGLGVCRLPVMAVPLVRDTGVRV